MGLREDLRHLVYKLSYDYAGNRDCIAELAGIGNRGGNGENYGTDNREIAFASMERNRCGKFV